MLESLLPFYKHWHLTHLLLVLTIAFICLFLVRGATYRKTIYTLLNSLLLVVLVIEGGNVFMDFLFRLLGAISPPEAPVFQRSFGYFLLLLYHGIGTWVGLLFFSRSFRQSTFFTIFMGTLVNVHLLADLFDVGDWWMTSDTLGYDLMSFVSIRHTPNILIREFDLTWLYSCLLLQCCCAALYFYFQHFLQKPSPS